MKFSLPLHLQSIADLSFCKLQWNCQGGITQLYYWVIVIAPRSSCCLELSHYGCWGLGVMTLVWSVWDMKVLIRSFAKGKLHIYLEELMIKRNQKVYFAIWAFLWEQAEREWHPWTGKTLVCGGPWFMTCVFLPLFLASMCLFTLETLHGVCLSGLVTTHPVPCTPPLSTLSFFLGAIYYAPKLLLLLHVVLISWLFTCLFSSTKPWAY